VEYGWALLSGIFWFFLSRLTGKMDDLEKGKASSDDLNSVRQNLNDEIVSTKQGLRELDRRVDDIDHATQLRLVPRDEYKADISALHSRCNILSDTKEDKVQDIRIVENADDKKKGK
jgi:chromosome segregation ATPase